MAKQHITDWQTLRKTRDYALLVGNGVNRYLADEAASTKRSGYDGRSWEHLIAELWREKTGIALNKSLMPGVDLTELADIITLADQGFDKTTSSDLQKSICTKLMSWKQEQQHKHLLSLGVPILTTNYDRTLSSDLKLFGNDRDNPAFHQNYPWSVYFSTSKIDNCLTDPAVWHINGTIEYPSSLRFSLSHYTGSIARARSFINAGQDALRAKHSNALNWESWSGAKSWLQVFMRKKLLIVGLSLNINEVFLRWLLIERARLRQERKLSNQPSGWYIQHEEEGEMHYGKRFFLNMVGIDVVSGVAYKEIYSEPWQ